MRKRSAVKYKTKLIRSTKSNVAVGAFMNLDSIWTLASIANGLIILANLAVLISLSKIVLQESRKYFQSVGKR